MWRIDWLTDGLTEATPYDCMLLVAIENDSTNLKNLLQFARLVQHLINSLLEPFAGALQGAENQL